MASAAGFKQQCPSCEALVPIRDPDLVGRKIDCPKCKYRFVVEDPADADGDAGPAKKSKKGDDKGGKKPAKGSAKRRTDEDGESSSGSKGGSNKVLIGALAGGVAVVGLIITAWLLWFQDDSSSTTKTTGVASTSASKPPPAEDTEEKKPAVEEKPAAASAEMVTNLLPPDTEGVCAVKLQNFVRTPLGNAVFASPGTFLVGGLEKNLGFRPSDVDLFLQGWNFTSNWTVSIIHNAKGFDKNAVVAALKLKPADAKIEDQEYFTAEANPWLDALGRAAFAKLVQTTPSMLAIRSGKLGARFYDDQTLVLADLEPLQAFLKAKGSFELHKPVKAEEKKEEGTGSASDTDAGGAALARKRMNMTMGTGGSRGAAPKDDFPTIASSGGGTPAQKAEGKPAETEAKESISYMTIQPAIKAMLDRLDSKQPILALAVDREAAKGRVGALSVDPLGFDVVFKDSQVVGAAIVWKEHLTFLMGGDFGNDDGAKRRLRDLEKKSGKDLTKSIGHLLGVPVDFLNEEEESDPLGGAGGNGPLPPKGGMGFGPGMSGGVPPRGGMPGAGGRRRNRGGAPGGGGDDMVGGAPGSRGAAPGMRGMGGPPGFGPPGFGPPGFGQNPNGEPPPPKEPAKATLRAAIQDRSVVMLTVEVLDNEPKDRLLNKIIRPAMIQAKGSLDMSGGRSRVHELAAASQHMAEKLQRQFPQAALERTVPNSRMGRPYAPDQRISWMAELLPYLGQSGLYAQINPAHSWRDPENVGNASTLISQFLSPHTAPESWWVKYPGVSDPVAATHFVGIAGVGLDAANYAASDPAFADKIGIFGYDRHTALRDITDGAANTILMAQVPPLVKRPWLAGGGATAVGVPEKNSVRPFVSLQPDGKKGTLVVMADGSVRFVSEKVSDEVFKALATIKGNESVILNREAPKVEAPVDEVVEAPPAPAVPPAAVPAAVAPPPATPPKEGPSKK